MPCRSAFLYLNVQGSSGGEEGSEGSSEAGEADGGSEGGSGSESEQDEWEELEGSDVEDGSEGEDGAADGGSDDEGEQQAGAAGGGAQLGAVPEPDSVPWPHLALVTRTASVKIEADLDRARAASGGLKLAKATLGNLVSGQLG